VVGVNEPSKQVIRGEDVPADEQVWVDVGKTLMPEKSLTSADALGKFVFANVAVVGTVLTGLGVVKELDDTLADSPDILGIPLIVALVAVSLVSAIVAIVPKRATFSPNEPAAVRTWYEGEYSRRTTAAVLAAAFFGAAIVIAAGVSVGQTAGSGSPSISGQLSGVGDQAKIVTKVEIEDLPEDSVVTTTLDGYPGPGTDGSKRLCTNEGEPDNADKFTTACDIEGVARLQRFRTFVTVKANGKTVFDDHLELNR
jgi:hypothetical protein